MPRRKSCPCCFAPRPSLTLCDGCRELRALLAEILDGDKPLDSAELQPGAGRDRDIGIREARFRARVKILTQVATGRSVT